jgi:hypothetical protein
MKGYENQVDQHNTKYFNQRKDNNTLIDDGGLSKSSISINIPEEYGVLAKLLIEDKITIYEICKNYSHIYETYYKVLERITLEHDHHNEREISEVALDL